jgi:hypothetical protein
MRTATRSGIRVMTYPGGGPLVTASTAAALTLTPRG